MTKIPATLATHQSLVVFLLGQILLVAGLALVWAPLALLIPGAELTALGLLRDYEPGVRRPKPREVER